MQLSGDSGWADRRGSPGRPAGRYRRRTIRDSARQAEGKVQVRLLSEPAQVRNTELQLGWSQGSVD
jgi:hypothetical protein